MACGYSLRETAVRARNANLADLSDVALLKRLRKSKEWLYELCVGLFSERGLKEQYQETVSLRLVDATLISEPGKTGSQWRVHYSLQWPSLRCDFFKLTATKGRGTAESLTHFPLRRGEYLLADRGYSNANSIHYAAKHGSRMTVRLNPQGIKITCFEGDALNLPEKLRDLTKAGQVGCWDVLIPSADGKDVVSGRICAVRKTKAAIAAAERKLQQRAVKRQYKRVRRESLLYTKYVIVFTTFSPEEFSPERVLECYRLRWQVELVFKRFKQIAALGHLPKYDDESSKAWLYGKLFVALLTEKLISEAESLSPWGGHF